MTTLHVVVFEACIRIEKLSWSLRQWELRSVMHLSDRNQHQYAIVNVLIGSSVTTNGVSWKLLELRFLMPR